MGDVATANILAKLWGNVKDSFKKVIANILAPILIDIAPELEARLARGGRIVLSGVKKEEAVAVVSSYGKLFDNVEVQREDSGWVLITGTKRVGSGRKLKPSPLELSKSPRELVPFIIIRSVSVSAIELFVGSGTILVLLLALLLRPRQRANSYNLQFVTYFI